MLWELKLILYLVLLWKGNYRSFTMSWTQSGLKTGNMFIRLSIHFSVIGHYVFPNNNTWTFQHLQDTYTSPGAVRIFDNVRVPSLTLKRKMNRFTAHKLDWFLSKGYNKSIYCWWIISITQVDLCTATNLTSTVACRSIHAPPVHSINKETLQESALGLSQNCCFCVCTSR